MVSSAIAGIVALSRDRRKTKGAPLARFWLELNNLVVIAGLVPATHENSPLKHLASVFMGGRHKAGHDVK
jgi:hypothetical protein